MSLYADRNIFHKWMGPAESCEECWGIGWKYEKAYPELPDPEDDIPDIIEVYCECEAGKKRKELER